MKPLRLRVRAKTVVGDMASTVNMFTAKMAKQQRACAHLECTVIVKLTQIVNILVEILIGGPANGTTTMQFTAAISNTVISNLFNFLMPYNFSNKRPDNLNPVSEFMMFI